MIASLIAKKKAEKLAYPVSYFRRIAGHSISPSLILSLPGAIKNADLIHLTATYSFATLPVLALAKLIGRPVVWSPRGAIKATHEWPNVPRKKFETVFEWFAPKLAPSKTIILATAQTEADSTQARMPNMRVEIVANGANIPEDDELTPRVWRPDGRLRLVFLSRLHKKRSRHSDTCNVQTSDNVELEVRNYLSQLQALVHDYDLQGRIRFLGHVDSEDKNAAFLNVDLFVLPTHSENFGIAIAESLAYGTPVITTTNTPWARINEIDCGECITLSVDELVSSIQRMEQKSLAESGQRGREWIKKSFRMKSSMFVYMIFIHN